jgi:hypothetical protein
MTGKTTDLCFMSPPVVQPTGLKPTHPKYVEGAVRRVEGWTMDFSLYSIRHLFSMVKDKASFTLVTGSTLLKTELLPKKVISGVSSLPNKIMLPNELGRLDKNTFF